MSKVSKKEKVFYMVVGIILVAAISICMTVRVQSRSREAILFDNRNYEAAEEMYKEQVKEVLKDYDCYNSGLTMTRVVSLEGDREYRLQIYHGKLQDMELGTFETLRKDLENCKVILPDGTEYEVTILFGI